ncbi:MAG: hypothetical protein IK104_01185 [Clostridia bacterium]|nr:hypothetical protein [Clostridia bacterium]
MEELNRYLGEKEFDGLITDVNPAVTVRGVTLAAPEAETSLKRGALLVKDEDGYIPCAADALDESCVILCDDVTYDAAAAVSVYTAGCFEPGKVYNANGSSLIENEVDEGDLLGLRVAGLYFKAAQKCG